VGRQPLIHKYLAARRLFRKRLSERPLTPRLPMTSFISRKSQRNKRRTARRRRVLVAAKSKRKARRRFRRKAVVIRKRQYPFTERAPVHAGRTVV
jgi:hypothetical protein